ncbi:MAG: hypothetical protein GYA86_03185 [Firmicutes bacterium]|nr:hypothetical protein [Bacillota bacterium]
MAPVDLAVIPASLEKGLGHPDHGCFFPQGLEKISAQPFFTAVEENKTVNQDQADLLLGFLIYPEGTEQLPPVKFTGDISIYRLYFCTVRERIFSCGSISNTRPQALA